MIRAEAGIHMFPMKCPGTGKNRKNTDNMNGNTANNIRNTFGFVGLGLIGGSIARAIRKYIPDARILAFTPHPETVQEVTEWSMSTCRLSEKVSPPAM